MISLRVGVNKIKRSVQLFKSHVLKLDFSRIGVLHTKRLNFFIKRRSHFGTKNSIFDLQNLIFEKLNFLFDFTFLTYEIRFVALLSPENVDVCEVKRIGIY